MFLHGRARGEKEGKGTWTSVLGETGPGRLLRHKATDAAFMTRQKHWETPSFDSEKSLEHMVRLDCFAPNVGWKFSAWI